MNKYQKRFFTGTAMVLSAMLSASLMTWLYDFFIRTFGHELRFQIIFGVGGATIGCATLIFAIATWIGSTDEQ